MLACSQLSLTTAQYAENIKLIDASIRNILKERYFDNESLDQEVYKYLKEKYILNKFSDIEFARNSVLLRSRLEPELKIAETLLAPKLFQKRLKEWFPLLSDNILKTICNLIKGKSLNPSEIFNIVSKKEDFITKFKPYIDELNIYHKPIVSEEIWVQAVLVAVIEK